MADRSEAGNVMTMKRLLALLALVIAAAACSSTGEDDPATTTTTTEAGAEQAGTEAPPPTEATTSTELPTTTLPETTTTTLATDGSPQFALAAITFGEGAYVTVANVGDGTGDVAGYVLCQFPDYFDLPPVELLPGQRLAVFTGSGDVVDVIGVVETVDAAGGLGDIRLSGGEMALYTGRSFDDPSAIVDYVEWGESGHRRSEVAEAAGIWPAGGFVEVPEDAIGIAAATDRTQTPADWFAEVGG